MCREQLGQALRVYSQEVPLAQARNINGLRAVFGEVRVAFPVYKSSDGDVAEHRDISCGTVATHSNGQRSVPAG
jgi:hypothetical protein